MKDIFLSPEGLEKIKKELKELKTVTRRVVAERIKEARSFGDLTENSAYEDAKEQQAFVEGRIAELEAIIRQAKIINQQNNHGPVSLGNKVTVKNDGEEIELTLVDRTQVSPTLGKISFDSPLGKALVGKNVGDSVEVETPSGKIKYKILKIE